MGRNACINDENATICMKVCKKACICNIHTGVSFTCSSEIDFGSTVTFPVNINESSECL